MPNTSFPRTLRDLRLLGFASQSRIAPSSKDTMANEHRGVEALERSVKAKVGKPTEEISDARLKRDIQHVATREDGLRFYSFRYLWDDAIHVGVMAQDLLRNDSWRTSVCDKNGYYTVNYERLSLRMATFDQWKERGLDALSA